MSESRRDALGIADDLSTTAQHLGRRALGLPASIAEAQKSAGVLGTLRHRGWQRSVRAGRSVDRSGRPLPWWTYSAIRYLEPRLSPHIFFLEFGAGNSTLWLADQGMNGVSYEQDRNWLDNVAELLPNHPSGVAVRVWPDPSDMASVIEAQLAAPHTADEVLVIIDGPDREDLVRLVANIATGATVLFDNSDRPEYQAVLGDLALDYLEIEFWGLTPGYIEESCTSLLIPKNNTWILQRRT